MPHESWCQMSMFTHSDAAQRLSDTFNLHRMADPYGSIGKWFASALADGRSDNVLYDNKQDAIRHQHHNEQYYAYTCIVPTTMNVCEAEVVLGTARKLYDRGLRMVDPDHRNGGKEVIKRLTNEDQFAQMLGKNTNLQMPWEA